VKYGSRVQIVLQDTSIVTTEEHPMHVHGFHFFVVGSGFGNFNPATDPLKFNLVDPPVRNTIGTPRGGWVAIRFVADNPGNVLYYCKNLLLQFVPGSHTNLFRGFLLPLQIRNLVHPLPHRLTSELGFGHGTSGRKWSWPFTVSNTSTARSTPMLRLRKHR